MKPETLGYDIYEQQKHIGKLESQNARLRSINMELLAALREIVKCAGGCREYGSKAMTELLPDTINTRIKEQDRMTAHETNEAINAELLASLKALLEPRESQLDWAEILIRAKAAIAKAKREA